MAALVPRPSVDRVRTSPPFVEWVRNLTPLRIGAEPLDQREEGEGCLTQFLEVTQV